MAQVPSEAAGVVAAVFAYSSICLVCSALVIWLTWTHHERTSYVALIAYFTTLSTTASCIQQVHVFVWWRDVIQEQFEHTISDPDNPQLAIANGSVGMDLVLYYFQYYSLQRGGNVCDVLGELSAHTSGHRAWALAQSVYGLLEKSRWKRPLTLVNRIGKFVAIGFPLITILSLQSKLVQSNFIAFILLADLPLMLSLAFGSAAVFAILVRYIKSRRRFQKFSVGYGQSNQSGNTGPTVSGMSGKAPRRQGVYDRWLLTRFSIAFTLLSAFEVTNTLFQIASVSNTTRDKESKEADFSVDRAKTTFLLFLPGVTPSLLLFAVFGTTKPFLRYMYASLVPSCIRIRNARTDDTERGNRTSGVPPAASGGLDHQANTSHMQRPRSATSKDAPNVPQQSVYCYCGADHNTRPQSSHGHNDGGVALRDLKPVPLPPLPNGRGIIVRSEISITEALRRGAMLTGRSSGSSSDEIPILPIMKNHSGTDS